MKRVLKNGKGLWRSGFTMVELLVVIVVIGILSSITLVGVSSYIEAGKKKNAKDVCAQVAAAWTQYCDNHHGIWFAEGLDNSGVKEMDTDMCSVLGSESLLDVLYIDEDGNEPAGYQRNKERDSELHIGLLSPLGLEMFESGTRGSALKDYLYQFVLDVDGNGIIDGSDGLPASLNPGNGGIRAKAAVWCWPKDEAARADGETFAQSW